MAEKQEQKKPKPQPAAKLDLSRTVFIGLLATVAGFFGGWYGGVANQEQRMLNDQTVQREIIDNESDLVNRIATDVSPSVVSVSVVSLSPSVDFFNFGRSLERESAGTGVILTTDGLIITNRHVIPREATEVSVILSDGTEVSGVEVVGRTNDSDPLDIAFLRIKDTSGLNLKPAQLADSDKVRIGDRVVAIGNALGEFQNTVTMGIISGYGRDIQAFDGRMGVESLQNLFQTDAAINSGNSGGPLVNMAGEVVGINVATATADNISFAIPINDVKGLIEIVLRDGKLERPYLGVRYVSLNEDIAEQLNLDITEGAYIPQGTSRRPSILPNSPAEKAGLQERDVIVTIGGQKVDGRNSVVSLLGKRRVGEVVDITVLRDGKEKTLQATLEAAPEQ
jgi:serine protease Do